MECAIFIGVVLVVAVVAFVAAHAEQKKTCRNVSAERENLAAMSPAERERYLFKKQEQQLTAQLTAQWGPLNPTMVCPHCQTKGKIRTQRIVQKKGISGDKATAAVITGGLSVLATGLSRKEDATQAFCGSCNNTWVF